MFYFSDIIKNVLRNDEKNTIKKRLLKSILLTWEASSYNLYILNELFNSTIWLNTRWSALDNLESTL